MAAKLADIRWDVLQAAKAGDAELHLSLRRQWWSALFDRGLTPEQIQRSMGPKREKVMPCQGCGATTMCRLCQVELM